MPQASDYLRSRFPDGDGQALRVVKTIATVSAGGVIRLRKLSWDSISEREREAICYLCDEWDYAYEPDPL